MDTTLFKRHSNASKTCCLYFLKTIVIVSVDTQLKCASGYSSFCNTLKYESSSVNNKNPRNVLAG